MIWRAHTPTTADDDKPRLPLHTLLPLILVIQVYLQDRQPLLPSQPRVQRQRVDGDFVYMALGVGEGVVEEDDADEQAETEDSGEAEPDEKGDVIMSSRKGSGWEP